MTSVPNNVLTRLGSVNFIPPPRPSSATTDDDSTAKSPDMKGDTAEPLNRCGQRGQLEHWNYKCVIPERAEGSSGEGFTWYKDRKQGFMTPEGKLFTYRWSLHLSDWFYLITEGGTAVLVSRSILHELGVTDDRLPAVTNKEDLEESEGLRKEPMRIEDLHYTYHNCYWQRSANNTHIVPKLDRTLDGDGRLSPNILIVHDPDNLTRFARHRPSSKTDEAAEPDDKPDPFKIKYVRQDASRINIPWVPLPPKEDPIYVAHLHLSKDRNIGSGNHSGVWQAHYDLPYVTAHELFYMCCEHPSDLGSDDPVSTHRFAYKSSTMRRDVFELSDLVASPPEDRPNGIPTRFSVAAKIAAKGKDEMRHLVNEAKMYGQFPQYLSCEWSGYQQVKPVHVPQACCAVVPKSYGFWVPEVTYSKLSNGVEVRSKNVSRLSPILLLEECGGPIDTEALTLDQRRLLLSMFERMQIAGFTQGSVFVRNILMQPGPLRVAPELRTMDKPSYRIIDFGRGVRRSDVSDASTFSEACRDEARAVEALLGFNLPLMY
ncbi:hypothetical protein FRB98_004816 [Tulasnella sp. 332]|nr:hypothetical protein FRB98_004816 [Tulasnella sp. 332]